jgi:hypothetical protein
MFSVYAYSVEIRFQDTTGSLSQATSTLGSISTLTTSPTTSPTSASGSTSKGKAGLSQGARAGIAISAVFVFLSLVLLSFVCLRRHGRRASNIAERTDNLQGLFLKPELEAGNTQFRAKKPGIAAPAIHEISELDTSHARTSERQHHTLGSVEGPLIPKHEVPIVLEMEVPHAPQDFPIQASSSTLRAQVARKSVLTEPENAPPQVQTSSSGHLVHCLMKGNKHLLGKTYRCQI